MKTHRIPAPRCAGQVLVGVLLLLAVALILVPALVLHVQNEAKWSVKQVRSDRAFHLAEAGQDKTLWHLSLSTANWSKASEGIPLAGYDFDVAYADLDGGTYKISVASGPDAGQVTVISRGRDESTKEVRSIRAVYSGATLISGFVAEGSIDYQNTFTVYWGQVTSYTGITQGGSPPYHPIKVSKGEVTPWDSDPGGANGETGKNYQSYVKLGDPPQVDFDYYREKAKNTSAPDPATIGGGKNGGQTAPWRGTGYFDGTKEVKWKNYTFNCSTCVFFLETSKAKIDGIGYLRVEALIVYSANIHIHNDGADPYIVYVPTDAWKQYTAGTVLNPTEGDSSATQEFPGDGGLNSVDATYSIPTAAFDGAGNTGMSFHGFLYSHSFNCNGGENSNVGQFLIGPGGTDISTMIIYFDPAVAQNVHYTRPQIQRVSWDEIVQAW